MEREKDLILKGAPCDMNYFDRNLLTIHQAVAQGRTYCINYKTCEKTNDTYCALRSGLEVAQNVIKGSTLEKELNNFSEADFLNGKFWDSINGKEFQAIQGKAKFIDAVERFARTVLLMNPSESVFAHCDKCKGVKLNKRVYDSIQDGPFPLSGSGKTRPRNVEYCPDCDPEPRGGILKEDPRDTEDLELMRKFKEQNKD
jgi:hypothetical protein